MTTQTPDAVREAVARIIDPDAFATYPFDPDRGEDFISAIEQAAEDAYSKTDAILAALDSRAGDAGEGREAFARKQADHWLEDMQTTSLDAKHASLMAMARNCITFGLSSVTPAPAVDAVPAGEVRRLARIRSSMAMLQQNSEGCAHNHYGDDATVHGMPGWLIDTKADLDAFTDLLAKWEAGRG